MTQQESIVEKLSQFNNLSFTRKQWDIILKGCGCPMSVHFWRALRNSLMIRESYIYTLIGVDTESFKNVWKEYSQYNVASVNKTMAKKEAKRKAQEAMKRISSICFFSIDGCLSSEKPERD